MSVETPWMNPWFEPYTNTDFKGLWILITAMPLKEVTAFADNETGGLEVGVPVNAYKLLAPQQIMETINNTWEPWETISSRMAGKGKEVIEIGRDIVTVGKALKSQIKGIGVGELFKNLGKREKGKFKVDTPLVYENTERREFTFQFNLVSNTGGYFMMRIVRELQQLSTPRRTKKYAGLGIEYPHVFKLECIPEPEDGYFSVLSKCNYMAITSIQPTYMAPYDEKGQPMRIELTITFKELDPLYSDSFTPNQEPVWN